MTQPSPAYANPDYAAQQHTPPPATYPTAPPWAAAAPSPAPADAPLPPYGQLLVPYPEEMQNASRAGAPSWWPIILWTFFLGGLLGLIPTVRRAGRARRNRNGIAPYWITWAVSVVVTAFVWNALVVPFAVGQVTNWLEHARTDKLQSQLVHDGQLKTVTGAVPTSAQCDPTTARGTGGDRRFTCLIRFNDDSTGTLDVIAATDGQWTQVPATK
jgi:hypothetical protein